MEEMDILPQVKVFGTYFYSQIYDTVYLLYYFSVVIEMLR